MCLGGGADTTNGTVRAEVANCTGGPFFVCNLGHLGDLANSHQMPTQKCACELPWTPVCFLISSPSASGQNRPRLVNGNSPIERENMETQLRRRVAPVALLLAAFAALVLLTTADPAAAANYDKSSVAFEDNCGGTTTVTVTSGNYLDEYAWTIAAGETDWTASLQPGETYTAEVPASVDEIVVGFEGHPYGWPESHVWTEPEGGCPLPQVTFEDVCYAYGFDGTLVDLANGKSATAPAKFVINGIHYPAFDPGVDPEPLLLTQEDGPITISEKVTGQTWEHTWSEPEEGCEEEPSPSPTNSPSPSPSDAPEGTAGSLPETGSAPLWIIMLGGTLTTIGVALTLLLRRRRVTFTA